ncbi:hypothetical protein Scep_020729 [Stephania cephalantha]|uniref:Uncharacterized protein n=1 Tax=Stephania cephalantha TaxID=152367 RepID=A0AAP0IDD6_9MAGN
MAATNSTLLHFSSRPRIHAAHHQYRTAEPPHTPLLSSRRAAVLLTASTFLATAPQLNKAKAEDIPLFGLRKKLKNVEEEAELVVREGFEAAEKGIEAAEKGVEAAEGEIETVLSYGGLAQAGVVAGAEFVGVVVATSVVNAILGSEGRKS